MFPFLSFVLIGGILTLIIMRRLPAEPYFICVCMAAVFLAAALLSCAHKEIDEPLSPVADKETSIPVSAVAPESTPVAAGTPGYLDPWFLVAEVKGERVYSVYVDTESIEEGSGGIESWNKLVFQESQRDKDGLLYKEVRISSSIDCAGKSYMYNSSKFYDSIGRLVYHENIEYNRTAITPDTLSAYIADFVCGYVYENESE